MKWILTHYANTLKRSQVYNYPVICLIPVLNINTLKLYRYFEGQTDIWFQITQRNHSCIQWKQKIDFIGRTPSFIQSGYSLQLLATLFTCWIVYYSKPVFVNALCLHFLSFVNTFLSLNTLGISIAQNLGPLFRPWFLFYFKIISFVYLIDKFSPKSGIGGR